MYLKTASTGSQIRQHVKTRVQRLEGYVNLADQIDQFPKFNPSTTRSVTGNDGLFLYLHIRYNRFTKAVIFKHSRWTLAYLGTYGHILNLGPDDVMYVTLPLYHATGVVVCWCGVIAGGCNTCDST